MTALIALLLDVAFGWPRAWFQRVRHPVVWIGWVISKLEHRFNGGPHRFCKGLLTSLLVIAAAALPALVLQELLGGFVAGVLAWPLVAARSLKDHVRDVSAALGRNDLPAARQATARIVGRDVSVADEAALSRAALESLAENASDGVVAPLFWAVVAGLPGIAAYKAINTLDSMIGHRTDRYRDYGRFAAKLDDAVNWIPARLTAALFAVAGRSWQIWLAARREAPQHRSPNAGWPEAAMARALAVRLSGPRNYGGEIAAEPWLNAAAPDPERRDIERGLELGRHALIVLAVVLACAAWVTG